MTRGDFKKLIRECLLEILAESTKFERIVEESSERRRSQSRVTSNRGEPRRPTHLDAVRYDGMSGTRSGRGENSESRIVPAKKLGGVFENTVPLQESRTGIMPQTDVTMSSLGFDDEEAASKKFEMLAFSAPIPRRTFDADPNI